jgi:hypothetical protein
MNCRYHLEFFILLNSSKGIKFIGTTSTQNTRYRKVETWKFVIFSWQPNFPFCIPFFCLTPSLQNILLCKVFHNILFVQDHVQAHFKEKNTQKRRAEIYLHSHALS